MTYNSYVVKTTFKNHEKAVSLKIQQIRDRISKRGNINFRVRKVERLEDDSYLKIFKTKRTLISYEYFYTNISF